MAGVRQHKSDNMVDYARKLAVVKDVLERTDPAEGILWWPYDGVPVGEQTVMGALDEAGFPLPSTNNRTTRGRILDSLRMLGVNVCELYEGRWPRYFVPPLLSFAEGYAVVEALMQARGINPEDKKLLAGKVLTCTREKDASRIRSAFRLRDESRAS